MPYVGCTNCGLTSFTAAYRRGPLTGMGAGDTDDPTEARDPKREE
jgi:hypothetical protein